MLVRTSRGEMVCLHLMRMSASLDSLSREISSYLACNVTNLIECLASILLSLIDILHWSSRARRRSSLVEFELGIFHGNLFLRINIQLDQARDLELVDLNSISICPEMETDGDELNDDLLDEVQGQSNENGNYDLVDRGFPGTCSTISVCMMVLHGW